MAIQKAKRQVVEEVECFLVSYPSGLGSMAAAVYVLAQRPVEHLWNIQLNLFHDLDPHIVVTATIRRVKSQKDRVRVFFMPFLIRLSWTNSSSCQTYRTNNFETWQRPVCWCLPASTWWSLSPLPFGWELRKGLQWKERERERERERGGENLEKAPMVCALLGLLYLWVQFIHAISVTVTVLGNRKSVTVSDCHYIRWFSVYPCWDQKLSV